MFRFAPVFTPVFIAATLTVTAPVLAQTTATDASPTGTRLTCSQPMPALDLGARDKPSKQKSATMCACIWQSLTKEDQEFGEGLKTGTSDSSDTLKMDRFSNNFGSALERCSQ